MIERKRYLDQLIAKKENGMIKVITGIRRCGKSYLLFDIYHQYLNSIGVDDSHIIGLALDDDENIRYRNPLELGAYIRSLLVDQNAMYYIFLDEIQEVTDWEKCVNSLRVNSDVDIYITGSNAKMLSGEYATLLSGRYVEFSIYPFSFAEYCEARKADGANK